jgi:hypothetical protein
VIFLLELLHMLGSGTARTCFEETATIHKRNDGEHLGTGAELENREKVGQVVTQHVASD